MGIQMNKEDEFVCTCGATYDNLDAFIFLGSTIACDECVEDYDIEYDEDLGYALLPK